jgi:hypothetical protein
MFKYLNNDRGAALMLTLFLVVFISIVGAALLNTTFYGQKNNIVAVAEQQEFYPLEGAIDMLLFEINAYKKQDPSSYLMAQDEAGNIKRVLDANGNPIPIINKGAYFYLADSTSPRVKTYKIDGKDIQVRIFNETVSGSAYKFTIQSNRMADKKLVRSIDVVANRGEEPAVLSFNPDIPQVTPFPGQPILGNYRDNDINPNQIHNVGKLTENFSNILRFYGINTAGNTATLTERTSFAGSDKHSFAKMTISNETTLTIPAGKLVFVDTINLTGGGRPNSTVLRVDGILIANTFDIAGNITYQINGAVLANNLIVSSNAITIGSNAGLNPGGSGGGYKAPSRDVTEEDYSRPSEIANITDMRTERQ